MQQPIKLIFGLVTVASIFAFPHVESLANDSDSKAQPNIVVIMTDDIDCDSLYGTWNNPNSQNKSLPAKWQSKYFPNLADLANQGVRFTNFHANSPVCGPSRASFLSGRYPHNTGVKVNRPEAEMSCGFDGGRRAFDGSKTLPVWMRKAGYETMHVGKYLHEGNVPLFNSGETWRSRRPKGWDFIRIGYGATYFKNFQMDFNVDFEPYNLAPIHYRTDFEKNVILEQLDRKFSNERDSQKPLFLCWATLAAHATASGTGLVAPRHQSLRAELTSREIGPKELKTISTPLVELTEFREISHLTEDQVTKTQDHWRDRFCTLVAVDEAVGEIRARLKQHGQLENTIFIFTSDHGYQFGTNHYVGKRLPRDRVTKVPFIVSGGNTPMGQDCDELLSMIDVAPTILELANGKPATKIDGVSFAPLTKDPKVVFSPKRKGIGISNWEYAYMFQKKVETVYTAIRTPQFLYVQWASGGREYFDIAKDPEQLNNLYKNLPEERKTEIQNDLLSVRHSRRQPQIGKRVFRSKDASFLTLYGYVEDDRAIQSVRLQISDLDSGRFWDGKNWIDRTTSVRCYLKAPRKQFSKWLYRIPVKSSVAEIFDGNRNASLTLLVKDSDGKFAKWTESISPAPEPPETFIDEAVWSPSKKILTVTGHAISDLPVKNVSVSFRDNVAKTFWNGKAWVDDTPPLAANILSSTAAGKQTKTKWRFVYRGEFRPSMTLHARAIDQGLRSDASAAFISFNGSAVEK